MIVTLIYKNDLKDECTRFFIHPEDVKDYLWREIVITKPRKDEKMRV